MTTAAELQQVADDLFLWQHYDPAVKAELFATAIACAGQTWLVDPIPLAETDLPLLAKGSPVGGVIVTNGNHLRASLAFAERFSVPIYARQGVLLDAAPSSSRLIEDGTEICPGLEAITIEGAAPGEIALHATADGGSFIVGDALINFEPYGFTFLPRKYCSNENAMRRSIQRLLERKAERLLFAHGTPILKKASERLRHLLDAGS